MKSYIKKYTFPNLYCVPESCTIANQSSSPTVFGSFSFVCSNNKEFFYIIKDMKSNKIT